MQPERAGRMVALLDELGEVGDPSEAVQQPGDCLSGLVVHSQNDHLTFSRGYKNQRHSFLVRFFIWLEVVVCGRANVGGFGENVLMEVARCFVRVFVRVGQSY